MNISGALKMTAGGILLFGLGAVATEIATGRNSAACADGQGPR